MMYFPYSSMPSITKTLTCVDILINNYLFHPDNFETSEYLHTYLHPLKQKIAVFSHYLGQIATYLYQKLKNL